jgi:hypothetical protein
VGFQKSACSPAVIRLLQPSSMIANVSLRLLYLIFNRLLRAREEMV